MSRLRDNADHTVVALLDDYEALDATHPSAESRRDFIERALALAVRLGGPRVTLDPANVVLRRVPNVTTWPIGSATHVVRNKADVFVLSAACADSWRQVIFGQSLAETRAAADDVRLFVDHGLVALAWRGCGSYHPPRCGDVHARPAADTAAVRSSSGGHDRWGCHGPADRPITLGCTSIRRMCGCVVAGEHGARERPRGFLRCGQERSVAGRLLVWTADRDDGGANSGQRLGESRRCPPTRCC